MVQFYMKLEEKLHAKEVEMTEIQIRTQVFIFQYPYQIYVLVKWKSLFYSMFAFKHNCHASLQEEAKTEIKQFRKSLNFKATPMPKFYNGAARGGTNSKKVHNHFSFHKHDISFHRGRAFNCFFPANYNSKS